MTEPEPLLTHNDEHKKDMTPDKKEIEAEEKEVMLKEEPLESPAKLDVAVDNEGPVKAALAKSVSEEGREVKPKFIPIGGIKMPGFFTRNSADKDKKEEDGNEDAEKKSEGNRKKRRLLFSCPFTKFLHHPYNNTDINDTSNTEVPPSTKQRILDGIRLPLRVLQRQTQKDPEAALASMETLDDKLETPGDNMENIKLDGEDEKDGQVETKLPLRERFRQRKFIVDDIVVCVITALVLLACLAGIIVSASAGPPTVRPLRAGKYVTTITGCGAVEGMLNDGAFNFYGIPYAQPPVGDKRFTYAKHLNNISTCWNGTLKAYNVTPPLCLQLLSNNTITGAENCLTLDIVTPHVRYDSPLPVVVLIGANSLSGGIGPAQPSAKYARYKEVVWVRPNFRLGPFGFLALDELSKMKYPSTSGNYGLSDLIVALEWIQLNIQHFGGDPKSVILLGHRAGATLASVLTTIRKVQKLYSRAWLTSGSVIFPGEQDLAFKDSNAFKYMSDCRTAECLLKYDPERILLSTPDTWVSNYISSLPVEGEKQRSWLVFDGDFIRAHPYDVWDEEQKTRLATGKDPEKIIVFGTTEHSGYSDSWRMRHLNWTEQMVVEEVERSVIGNRSLTNEVFKHFNKTYEGLAGLISAVRTVCPLISLARFRLDAPMYLARGIHGDLATIDADIEAILGTFVTRTEAHRRFVSAMQNLFYYFVWHGKLPDLNLNSKLIQVAQDPLPLQSLPICDLLIREDIVPRYAYVD